MFRQHVTKQLSAYHHEELSSRRRLQVEAHHAEMLELWQPVVAQPWQ
jgi:hypothetical protein